MSSFNYYRISPLTLERREDNIDRIYKIQDIIARLVSQNKHHNSGVDNPLGINRRVINSDFKKSIKHCLSKIRRLQTENKEIDLEILIEYKLLKLK